MPFLSNTPLAGNPVPYSMYSASVGVSAALIATLMEQVVAALFNKFILTVAVVEPGTV